MTKSSRLSTLAATASLCAGLIAIAGPVALKAQAVEPANPCAPKMANPCAPKAPQSNAGQPDVDPKLVLRPKGTKLASGDPSQLIKQGKALFEDSKLSTNGASCQTCHAGNESFAPGFAAAYPHEVAMAKEKGGVNKVHLDEMIQFCMVVPMEAKPLRWNSTELAALTAYTGELQKAFRKKAK